MDEKVKFIIEIDETGQPIIKSVGSDFEKLESTVKKTGGALQTLKAHWLELSAGVLAAWQIIKTGLEYIDLGGQVVKVKEAFAAMTASVGADADKLTTAMRKAAGGFIDDTQLMQKAVFALSQDIDPDKIPQLFEAARTAARLSGKDIETSLDTIVQAVSTNMPRSLKQMGLISKEELKILEQAAAAGVTEIKLLDLVLANAALKSAQLGESSNNAAKDIARFKVECQEAKEGAGELALWISSKLVKALKGLSEYGMAAEGGMDIPVPPEQPGATLPTVDQAQAAKDAIVDELKRKTAAAQGKGQAEKLAQEAEAATNEYRIALAGRTEMEIFMEGDRYAALQKMEQEHRTGEMEQLTASAEFKAALDQSEYDRALALMEARTALEAEAEDRRQEAMQNRISSWEDEKDVMEGIANSYNVTEAALRSLISSEISYGQMRGALKNAIAADILGYESLGVAIKKATANLLANIAAEAAIRAMVQVAAGFAALAVYDFGAAANHFQAAAIYGAVAAAAGVAAKALMSSAGGASASESAGYQEASGGNVESVASAGEAQGYAQKWDVTIVNPIGTSDWIENTLVPELKKVAKRDTQITVTYA